MSTTAVLDNDPRSFITVTQLIPNVQNGAGAQIPATEVHIVGLNTVGVPVVPPTRSTNTETSTSDMLGRFLKVQPKALGAVQIIMGLVSLAFGIVLEISSEYSSATARMTILLWCSPFHIIAGSVLLAAGIKLRRCLVIGSQRINVSSAITAAVTIYFLSEDLAVESYPPCNYPQNNEKCDVYRRFTNQVNGISGVLMLFSAFQFIISSCIIALSCNSTCCTKPTVSVVTEPPNYAAYYAMPNSFQTSSGQGNVFFIANPSVNMNNPTLEDPPAYSRTLS
ncbi:membrane-spanning 4-domains subfamily A member 4A-like [Salminus brasiliensis]|uniref:membrane-spanning 4-domains subfamily A member 4A-like n=1 Tax=Salminus brasiliensis TaxID=930266 RepID=UPI003B838BB6